METEGVPEKQKRSFQIHKFNESSGLWCQGRNRTTYNADFSVRCSTRLSYCRLGMEGRY